MRERPRRLAASDAPVSECERCEWVSYPEKFTAIASAAVAGTCDTGGNSAAVSSSPTGVSHVRRRDFLGAWRSWALATLAPCGPARLAVLWPRLDRC